MKILNIVAAFLRTSTKLSCPFFKRIHYFFWKKRAEISHIGILIQNFLCPKDWKKCYFMNSWCYILSVASCLTSTFAVLSNFAAGAQTMMRGFHRTQSPHCCTCVIREQRRKGSLSQRESMSISVRRNMSF